MLGYLLESLGRCRSIDGITLATSAERSDDALAEFGRANGADVYRGELDNVAARMLGAARHSLADAFVRISGDSPLLDPAIVDYAANLYRQSPVDMVTNVLTRTFPKGQSVEVVSVEALARALGRMTTDGEREHVTPYIYAHPGEFTIRSFVADPPRPEVQLSVDEEGDFRRCEAILRSLGTVSHCDAGWRHFVAACDGAIAQPNEGDS